MNLYVVNEKPYSEEALAVIKDIGERYSIICGCSADIHSDEIGWDGVNRIILNTLAALNEPDWRKAFELVVDHQTNRINGLKKKLSDLGFSYNEVPDTIKDEHIGINKSISSFIY